jgi:hypothetical protein
MGPVPANPVSVGAGVCELAGFLYMAHRAQERVSRARRRYRQDEGTRVLYDGATWALSGERGIHSVRQDTERAGGNIPSSR